MLPEPILHRHHGTTEGLLIEGARTLGRCLHGRCQHGEIVLQIRGHLRAKVEDLLLEQHEVVRIRGGAKTQWGEHGRGHATGDDHAVLRGILAGPDVRLLRVGRRAVRTCRWERLRRRKCARPCWRAGRHGEHRLCRRRRCEAAPGQANGKGTESDCGMQESHGCPFISVHAGGSTRETSTTIPGGSPRQPTGGRRLGVREFQLGTCGAAPGDATARTPVFAGSTEDTVGEEGVEPRRDMRKTPRSVGNCGVFSGGSDRRRSGDLSIFSRTLYQLSYRAMRPSSDDHRIQPDRPPEGIRSPERP
jgi:hypothetical protein